ncbi:hypothetical protein B7P43_G04811 [Cryptotermes secundus]|uniref:DUF4817 domain-containing protein n=1 Tax=Cryptotermes secundus TaxID=105785 RepID=A0A2J7R3B2_9NEOP|nr:hypothetical protein B7P43_G04811 [Cryptotermes secundus]
MASLQQKAFCVLEFAKTNSVVTVQRAFRRRFGINPPCPTNIRRWFRQFQESGCLCKGKSLGRPRVSAEALRRADHSSKEAYRLCEQDYGTGKEARAQQRSVEPLMNEMKENLGVFYSTDTRTLGLPWE